MIDFSYTVKLFCYSFVVDVKVEFDNLQKLYKNENKYLKCYRK